MCMALSAITQRSLQIRSGSFLRMRRAGIRRAPMDRSYTARLEEARLVMLDVAGRAMGAAAVSPEEAGSPHHAACAKTNRILPCRANTLSEAVCSLLLV